MCNSTGRTPEVPLDGQECIGSLDRSMLASVAGQDQPRIMLAAQSNQFEHLPPANLTGLIHDDGSVIGKFTLEEKLRHGRRRGNPAFSMSTTCWR